MDVLVQRAAALLATSLFMDATRNRLMMMRWLHRPVATDQEALAAPSTGHAKQRRRGPSASQQRALLSSLAPAVTSQRRVARATIAHALSSMRDTPAPERTESTVDALVDLIHAVLTARIHLMFSVRGKDNPTFTLHLFGMRQLAHVCVPDALLNGDERTIIDDILHVYHIWAVSLCDHDVDRADEDAREACGDALALRRHVLAAGPLLNDAFDTSLDRIGVVWALCDTIMYGAGEFERVRHVLEAALLATASRPDVLAAGWHARLLGLAWAVRAAPLVPATRPAARFSLDAVSKAHEFARKYATRTVTHSRPR